MFRLPVLMAFVVAATLTYGLYVVFAANQFWRTDGTSAAWSSGSWGTSAAGPFSNTWTNNNDANFTANSAISVVTASVVGNINVTNASTVTLSPANTFATGGNVRTFDVGAGSILDFAAQNISTTAGTGIVKNGAGIFFSSNGNTYPGGFTLNAGTMIIGGVNSMGNGGPLTINGGTLAANATRNITSRYASVTVGGDFTLGAVTTGVGSGNGSSAANITFADNMGLGVATRTITIGSNGTYTLSGILSSATAGTGLTVSNAVGATGKLVLSGASTYTGNTTINGGILNAGSAETAGTSGPFGKQAANAAGTIVLGGGILQYSAANTNDYSGRFSTAASQAYNIDTNAQTVTFASALTSSGGTLTKSGTGTLVLTAGNTYSGLTTVSAGTLQLNKTGGTTIPVSNSVTINGGTLKVSTDQTIGALTMSSGTLTVDSGTTLTITGTYGVSGGTINNLGKIKLNGSTASFPGSGVTVNNGTAATMSNLEVATSGAVTLTASMTISGGLTLTSGILNGSTNSATLSVTNTANSAVTRTSGYIDGKLQWSLPLIASSTTYVFPLGTANGYSPLTLAIASTGGPTTFTASATQTVMPGVQLTEKALQKYWSLSTPGTVTSTPTFVYLDADIPGTSTEANYRIFKDTNSTGAGFSFPDAGADDVNDATNTATTLSAVSTFSNWSVAEPNAPTAVKLMSFTATNNNNGEVALQWQSGYEARNLGYYVYREQNGKREQLTPSLIAGSALTTGQETVVNGGLSYTWYDEASGPARVGKGQKGGGAMEAEVLRGATYWLEDVDLDGTRTLHGPIAPAVVYTNAKVRSPRSPLLDEVAARASTAGTTYRSWAGTSGGEETQLAGRPSLPRQKGMLSQREITGLPGVKLAISKAGWYRVTRAELLAAGLDLKDTGTLLQLYANAVQVPMRISGDGSLAADTDYLEFYGQGLESGTEAAQTYYLIVGKTAGLRIAQAEGVKSGVASGVGSYAYTIERKDRWIYYSALLNGEAENIFGHLVRATPVNETLPVGHPDPAGGAARLEVSLVGVSLQEHHVRVTLNGSFVGTMDFANAEHPQESFNVPASLLVEGDNTVQLSALTGSNTDTSLVDTVRLTYAHLYQADNNALTISLNGTGTKRIGGFTEEHIRAVDITDGSNQIELKPQVLPEGEKGYAADVRLSGIQLARAHTVLVFADSAVGHPDSIRSNEPSSWWSQTEGADYLLITSREFVTQVEPLAALRRNQGLVVKVVDVEDLYDEFSYGAHSPKAIHDFLETATTSWVRKPHYVLLAGDASYDPKNYLGQGNTDYVPTKLIDTGLMETASDDWLADFDNDGIADLAIGRLPLRTAAGAEQMVSKIVAYEQTAIDPQRGTLLVADNGFEAASSAVQSLLPAGMPQQVINRNSADDTTIHNQIMSSLNQGPRVVNFMGHGGNGTWTGALLLTIYDAPALTNNSHLSVYVMMTCMNGYFQNAYNDSLSESLLRTAGGAVAVWSSSGMTDPGGQNLINQEFYRQVFGPQPATLGDAARLAKAATTDPDVRRTWLLLGDPAMRIR